TSTATTVAPTAGGGSPIHTRSFAQSCTLGGTHESTHHVHAGKRDHCSVTGARRRGDSGAADQCRPGAAELADESPHLCSQRYSPLDQINKANVKSLKIAYAVAIGGTSANESLQATPLAEDGFLYVTDQWGVLYKADGRSGDVGRIVWRMDPGQEKIGFANRGAALWGNFVISIANHPPRMIATDKESGKVVWETNLSD